MVDYLLGPRFFCREKYLKLVKEWDFCYVWLIKDLRGAPRFDDPVMLNYDFYYCYYGLGYYKWLMYFM